MKTIIIYSGGLDSTVLLYKLLNDGNEVEAIHFNYGQVHEGKESVMARINCKRNNVPLTEIPLDFIKNKFDSDLLRSAENIPEGHYAADNMKSTVVPFRNGIMLSIAAGYAWSVKAGQIAIANHAGDHPIYPDCRTEFIESMNDAIIEGTDNRVKLISPFCNMTKADIVKLGHKLKVPFENTWSCYKGGEKHCGKCGTCVERIEAFELADVTEDLTEYER